MDTERCWEIIEAARADANLDWDACDNEEHTLDVVVGDALVARLKALPLPEILAFEVRFSRLQGRLSLRKGVHQALYVMTLGVGDDGFTDFCAGLVALGRHWYDLIVADPDNLADHPAVLLMAAGRLDRYALLAEGFQYAANEAYGEITGDVDALFREIDDVEDAMEDDRGPEPPEIPSRMLRLRALFPDNDAVLARRFGETDIDYSNTMAYEPRAAVIAFKDRINHRDLDGLVALMSDDHTLIDASGTTVTGKAACTEAWRTFFATYPDYRNRFHSVTADDGVVTADGRSECGTPDLAGPGRWTATVHLDKITRWQMPAPGGVPG
ncbi:DUF4240 domain-containing protein [Actinoplanes subglobosus]|uniref:DUF4240 domain-containing protein n=1 Tax=Actinoplanes subglobosus TaxID=1547892 RepID=A0ABV8IGZ2_9ACTN